MKRLLLAVASILIGFQSLAATLPLGPGSIFPIGPSVTGSGGAIYYVANGGSDTNNGLSAATAWQTIGKVNGSGLGPNVTVLFNGGQTFSGGLVITQSVSPSNITIASYGTGQATISSGNSAACLSATNVAGVNFSNIICTGGGNATNTTAGISIVNSQAGNTKLAGPTISGNTISGYGSNGVEVKGTNGSSGFSNIVFSSNTIHDVTGNDVTAAGTSCIRVGSSADYGSGSTTPAHVGVLITNNLVYNCTGKAGSSNWSGSGIFVAQSSNVTIGGSPTAANVAHDFAVNSTFSGGGPSGIWAADGINVTISYNEAYRGLNPTVDGDGFDLDGGIVNGLMEHNYSHDNGGWGFLVANYQDSANLPYSNVTVRFNISQNNGNIAATGTGEMGMYFQRSASGPVYIYNNSFSNETSGVVVARTSSDFGSVTATIANNLILTTLGKNALYIPTPSSISFTGNDYYTYGQPINISWNGTTYASFASWQTATSQEKISGSNVGLTGNPSLYVPGGGFNNGGYVPGYLMAYNLQAGSAMIGAGLNLTTQFSINPGSTDYFGTTISAASLPVGAANGDFTTFVSSCAATTTFLARVSSFTKADDVQYNSVLCGLNSTGDLALVDALYITAAPNTAASLLNLVSTSFSLVTHGSCTFTARTGIAGDAFSCYEDTQFTPPGTHFLQNSASFGVYNRTAGSASTYVDIGSKGTNMYNEIAPWGDNPNGFAAINEGGAFNGFGLANAVTEGFFLLQRTGASAAQGYFNGAASGTGTTEASGDFTAANTFFLLALDNGAPANHFSGDQISAAFIGGLPSQLQMWLAIQAFMQGYGINAV